MSREDCIYAEGTGLTTKQAAQLMGVSERSVYQAGRVKRECSPEVVEAVRNGSMSLTAALRTIEKDRSKTLSLTLPAEIAAQVEQLAEERGLTVSGWLQLVVRLMLSAIEAERNREGDE